MKADDLLVELARLNNTATTLLELAEKLVQEDIADEESHSTLTKAARYVVNCYNVMSAKYQEVAELEREQKQAECPKNNI